MRRHGRYEYSHKVNTAIFPVNITRSAVNAVLDTDFKVPMEEMIKRNKYSLTISHILGYSHNPYGSFSIINVDDNGKLISEYQYGKGYRRRAKVFR